MRRYTSYFPDHFIKAGSLTAAMILAFSGSAFSKNIGFKMDIIEKAVWDSNPLMISRGNNTIRGSETTATLGVNSKLPNSKVDIEISTTRNQFNRSEFNSTDFHGLAGVSWNSARWEASVNGGFNYDTTRTSELTTLGRNIGTVRHISYLLSPKISYKTSLRSKMEISGSVNESRYADSSLSDFRTISISPSFIYSLDPNQQVILSAQAQRYQSLEDIDLHIDSIGPSIGWSASLTPTLSAQLSVGIIGSKTSGDGISDSSFVWNDIFSGALLYNDEQDTINLSATRSRQPFSNGTEFIVTSFSAQETHNFNQKLALDVKANYQFSEQPDNSIGNLDTIWGTGATLSYKKTKQWDITTSYKYREQTLTGTSESAKRNIVMIGLSYRAATER